MSKLWTPPTESKEVRSTVADYTASVDRMVDRMHSVISSFTADLKKMDPDMELIFAPPNAEADGLVPGRFHVMRRDRFGGPPLLIPIQGPNGEFVEPDSGLFEYLRKCDLWNGRARADRDRAKDEAVRAAERRREREREERHEELRERWRAATETSISMNRSSPWTQNASGRRGAKKAA